MFIPLHDGVPMRNLKAPTVTYALIALTSVAWLAVATHLVPIGEDWVMAGLGMIPAALFDTAALPEGVPFIAAPLTLVTSVFLHASLLHLAGNMLFLWVFGDNVEDALGHGRFLAFYLLCGISGALAHAAAEPNSLRPLIGASGAVSGVVAAYLILHPRVKVWGLFLNRIPLRLRAHWAIGFWIIVQIGQALVIKDGSVGWFAHLGGLITGAALVLVLRRADQPLLGRDDGPQLTGDT
jgi:membrane associated rhomboid family serine protease